MSTSEDTEWTIMLKRKHYPDKVVVCVPTDNNPPQTTISPHPQKYNPMEFPVMELGQTYFYTATILKWQNLLKPDKYKDIIISSLKYLVDKGKIKVYAFVIMPNHIHIVWQMLEMNGKELPCTSFMKYTGHSFLKDLSKNHPQVLPFFEVNTSTRVHHFWQRNSLPVVLYSSRFYQQKINYIHLNPLQEKWQLADEPKNYKYSSARFYEEGIDEFGILSRWDNVVVCEDTDNNGIQIDGN